MRPMPIICLLSLILPFKLLAKELDLNVANYEHIRFDSLKPTVYSNEKEILIAKVDESSSILMMAFDQIQTIRSVSIEWQSAGDLRVKNYEHQISKKGDDARFRIGLILSGKAPVIPFFAPTWVKRTKDILNFPSDKMIYLVLGAEAGRQWKSPYSDSIETIALEAKAIKSGWFKSQISFSERKKLVGIWLFADGDDTKSKFVTNIRKLELNQ